MTTAHQLYKNNATSTLNGTLSVGATTINLAVGHGNRFPALSAGQYFYITLFEKDGGGNEITYEIAKVTSITSDTLTAVRDSEGIVVAAGGTSGGWAYPSAVGVNPSGVVHIELRYTAYSATNNLTKDGNLEGLDSTSTARTNLGLGSLATQNANNVAITGGTITGVSLTDSTTLFTDDADPTKKMQFQLSSVGTGLTRTITIPNTDITLPGVNVANTWAAAQTFSSTINKVTVTPPTTSATLTISDGKTLTVPLDSSVSGTNTGDNAANSTYSSDYRAANFVAGTNYVAPGGALGTPSSGTLTSCTGLPPGGVTGTAATLGANTFTAAQNITAVNKGSISSATVTFDWAAANVQYYTATGSTVTWAFSNIPASGTFGEMLIVATNQGLYTLAAGSTVNWELPDGTYSTSIATYLAANTGRTALKSSGVDNIYLWTSLNVVYGKLA